MANKYGNIDANLLHWNSYASFFKWKRKRRRFSVFYIPLCLTFCIFSSIWGSTCYLGLDFDRKVAYPQSKKHVLRYSFSISLSIKWNSFWFYSKICFFNVIETIFSLCNKCLNFARFVFVGVFFFFGIRGVFPLVAFRCENWKICDFFAIITFFFFGLKGTMSLSNQNNRSIGRAP